MVCFMQFLQFFSLLFISEPVKYELMQLEDSYRYIKKVFIEPKQKILAILKLNKMFKLMTFKNHYRYSWQQEDKWNPNKKAIEIKPEVLLDTLWNPLELPNVIF